MATAGSIVVDLLMKTGSFETDAQRASRAAQKNFKEIEKQAKATADGINRAFSGLLSGAVFGIGVGTVFTKFIQETKNAQNEQAQLAAVLRSTGQAAGYSLDQLNKMATGFANASVFSEGEINQAQTRLLSYTGIVGEEFPRAMQAVIDMSARLGVSVEQSAETIGKALDIPSQGLTALSKQGFRFTEDQKKLVEQLEKAGKTAEAQGIVLAALESSYGGAAAAARDTLGGALQALQNQIDSLMTGDDGSVNGLTASVNDLTDVLGSPEAKQAFADFVGWLAEISKSLVTMASDFAEGMRAAGGFVDALITYGTINPFNSHAENAEKYRKQLVELEEFQRKVLAGEENAAGIDVAAKIQMVRNQLAFSERKANAQERDVLGAYLGVGETGSDAPTLAPIRVAASSGGRAAGGGKERLDQGQKLIDQMNQRIALIGKETEYEKLLEQVRIGSVTFKTQAQQDEALASAQTLDFINEQTKAYEESKKQAEDFAKLMDDLYPERSRAEQFIEQMGRLSYAFQEGWINAEQMKDATEALTRKFEETTGDMGEFAKEAARGIQNSLGDGLYQVMQGDFKNIGSSFLQMLQKMSADALAAQLAKKMFGDYDKSGSMGGWFGAIFKGVSSYFGGSTIGGTDSTVPGSYEEFMGGYALGGYTGPGGKYDVAGIVHRGEYVLNSDATKRLGRGLLDRLNGFADGGYVGSDRGPAGLGMGGMSLNIETRGVDIEVVEARQNEMYLIARQVVATDTPGVMQREIANPSSRSSRQLSRSTTAERRR